ncbi:MAG: ABC transporter substrate-binding protein, partial [Deltaproteobacteria bacterium]|nr:ABC transporter substrate-binding protein [Deltaproteobacteria bacterium]
AVQLFDYAKDTFIISPTAFEKNGEKWADYNPIGTGPFKLIHFKRNRLLKYKKFEDYWKKDRPYLDEIHVVQIPDPMTYAAVLRKGDVDALMGVDFITAGELDKTGKFTVNINRGGTQLLQFNSEDPNSIWSNREARKALEYAIDKPKITKAIGRGYLIPVYETVCMIPPGAGTTLRKYDPQKAKQLLKEAGYPDGIKIKLTYMSGPITKDAVVALQNNLANVGINVVPKPLSPAAFNQVSHQPAPPNDLVLGGQRGGRNELLVSVDETLAPGSVFFRGMKRPDGFVDLLHKALQSMNFDETMQYLFKMEKLAYEDAFFVPLWRGGLITVEAPYVKDAVWFWASMPYPNLEGAWLDK